MRNVIFHSTLDWQTKEEFEAGAREAYEEYHARSGFYDAENKFHIYSFHLAKTEGKLAEAGGKLQRATTCGIPQRIARCQAEVEKLRKKRDHLAAQSEFWERCMLQFAGCYA